MRKHVRKVLGSAGGAGILAVLISVVAVPLALASTENPSGEYRPEGVPPSYTGTENPGTEHMPEEIPPTPEGVPPENPGSEHMPEAVGPPEGVPAPEEVPPGYSGTENPGVPHRPAGFSQPTGQEARAIGRDECQEFKKNFRENKSQFGKCVAAVAMALRSDATPQQACAGLSRKPQSGEHRSDFSACVAAAARALREQKGGGS